MNLLTVVVQFNPAGAQHIKMSCWTCQSRVVCWELVKARKASVQSHVLLKSQISSFFQTVVQQFWRQYLHKVSRGYGSWQSWCLLSTNQRFFFIMYLYRKEYMEKDVSVGTQVETTCTHTHAAFYLPSLTQWLPCQQAWTELSAAVWWLLMQHLP